MLVVTNSKGGISMSSLWNITAEKEFFFSELKDLTSS